MRHPAKRLAAGPGVAHLPEIPQRDLHVDAVAPEAARITHEGADVLAPLNQERQERLAHRPGGSGQKNHAGEVT